jgi:hypothetical protein
MKQIKLTAAMVYLNFFYVTVTFWKPKGDTNRRVPVYRCKGETIRSVPMYSSKGGTIRRVHVYRCVLEL